MKLAIAILNWNGLELLKRFLPSLCKYTSETYQIYIIDNCSEDDSVNFIKKNFDRIKVIKLNKNYGYAKGYNIGLKNINAEIICLLNNDVEVSKNWTEPIIQQFKKEKNTAVIQPKLKNQEDKRYFDYAGAAGGFLDKYGYPYCNGRIYNVVDTDENQYEKIYDIFWACGACFFMRKKYFDAAGRFDEKFWAHMEEIDLCWRLKNMGFDIKYNYKSTVYHVNAATLKTENYRKTYYNFRNQLYMLTKNSCDNLFLILFEKFFVDLLISLFILFTRGLKHFIAIIVAYFTFYKNINDLIKFRKNNKRSIKHYGTRSIILKYLKLKK